jgi:hypothetical protein
MFSVELESELHSPFLPLCKVIYQGVLTTVWVQLVEQGSNKGQHFANIRFQKFTI